MSEPRPVLLLDVMSTLVTEPFLEAMPRFFGMTFEEFRASRDPKRWVEFEHGRITEAEYVKDYFDDGRKLDVDAFKKMLYHSYEWMDGVEPLLERLKAASYPMYALSNYSQWYKIIESKLTPSRFLGWDFVSCETGYRKPQAQAYTTPIERLQRPAADFIFVDDRQINVDAATKAGMKGILRTPNIEDLVRDLKAAGIANI
ncbi:MAG: HAD-IA family hydrolase [Myxococcota bacterium]